MKDNQIEVIDIVENDDGTAKLTLEMSDETFDVFFREGIRLLIPDEYKNKVKVCSPDVFEGKNDKVKMVEMPEDEIHAIFEFAVNEVLRKYIEEQQKKEKSV